LRFVAYRIIRRFETKHISGKETEYQTKRNLFYAHK